MSKALKYNKDLYTDCGYFDGDMDCEYTNEVQKIVKCRKPHKCVGCGHNCEKEIQAGDYALKDTALFPGEGWKSCYVCIPCIEEWLDELEGLRT